MKSTFLRNYIIYNYFFQVFIKCFILKKYILKIITNINKLFPTKNKKTKPHNNFSSCGFIYNFYLQKYYLKFTFQNKLCRIVSANRSI